MSYIMFNRETFLELITALTSNDYALLQWLYLSANFTDKTWNGIEVKRGQIVSSIGNISNATGLSIQQIRDGLQRLVALGEIAKNGTSKFSVLTLLNYDSYTSGGEQGEQTKNKRRTNEEQQLNNVLMEKKDIYIEDYLNTLRASPEFFNDNFKNVWAEWVQFRIEQKKRLTPVSIKKQIKFLTEHSCTDAIQILEQSMRNQWTGLFELKDKNNGNTNGVQVNKRGMGIATDFSPETLRREAERTRAAMGLPPMDDGYQDTLIGGTRLSLVR